MPGNNLLIIDKITYEDGVIKAIVSINQNSEILKGHFPGQPVVPGACMLQALKDVLAKALNNPIRLKKASQLKFISMIDARNTKPALLEIHYKYADKNAVNVTGKLISDETVCFKFQGDFLLY